MTFSLGVLLFAIGIGVSIALHEFGHLLSARAYGMKATQYFIGFGPTLFSFRRGETEYGLKAIPAGGFVKIIGMTPLEEEADGRTPAGPHSGWSPPPSGLGARPRLLRRLRGALPDRAGPLLRRRGDHRAAHRQADRRRGAAVRGGPGRGQRRRPGL